MKIDFDFEDTIYSINEEIAKIPDTLSKEKRTILNKSAKILKANVEKKFKDMESDIPSTTANYDGSTPYVHLVDEVKTSIKDDKKGNMYAVVKGGKYTGYKWHLLENGTSSPVRPATHFIEKTLKETSEEINAVIDEALRKAVHGGE